MAAGWHVVQNAIRQDTDLAPGGAGLQDVYVVPYVIDTGPASGQQFEVRIAKSMYTAQNVGDYIRRDVATHDEVSGLAQTGD